VVHVLDNGMRVVLQPTKAAPVVAIQMWVNVGSADDSDRTSGISHVLEHMIFKGTSHRSEGEIAREIEGAGGQINAWTSFDQTVFHVVIASRYFQRGLEILADALQNARLDDAELKRELQVILEEIKQGEDTTSRVVSRRLFNTAYRQHPYRRPVIGERSTVASIGKDDVRSFYNRWYVPSNMTLVIVGDVTSTRALEQVRRLFRGMRGPTSTPKAQRPAEPVQRRLRVSVKQRETQEAYVAMAFHIPGLLHPDTPALDLAAVVLGQGESSRLTRRVKHEQQLTTTSYAYAYTPADPGLLVVGATTPPSRVEKVVQALSRETFTLGAAEVSAAELRRAKTLIESDVVYQKETVQGLARKLGFYQTVAGAVAFEDDYNRRIADVTPESLREVIARYLKPQNMSVSAILPPQERTTARQLQRDLSAAVKAAHGRAAAMATKRTRARNVVDRTIKVTLENGARLLVQRDDTVPLIAMRGVWEGGLRYETDAVNGINSLLAALITRGTATRTADQVSEAIEGMAGAVSGFSGQNSFGIHAEMLSRHWEQGLEIVADCVRNPAFVPQEVERQRRTLLEDIIAQDDNLGSVVMRLFNRTLFKRHPYRLSALGTVTSVSALTREQLVRYYRRHYPASRIVLSVVGDVDPERVEAKFRRLFGSAPRRAARPVQVRREPPRAESEEAILFVNKQQVHMVVGYPGTTLRSNDRYVLEVLTSALSGQGGRLFTELRDRKGLAYQVGAYSQEGLEPGYIGVYMATSPEKVTEALAGIDEQLKRVREQPLAGAELKRIQRYLVGTYEISLQRRAMLASYLALNECYGLGFKAYAEYASRILAVTAKDVQRVARRYLVNSKRVVALVKPEEFSPSAARRVGANGRQAGVVTNAPRTKSKKKRAKKRKRK
jgi:zinc protease